MHWTYFCESTQIFILFPRNTTIYVVHVTSFCTPTHKLWEYFPNRPPYIWSIKCAMSITQCMKPTNDASKVKSHGWWRRLCVVFEDWHNTNALCITTHSISIRSTDPHHSLKLSFPQKCEKGSDKVFMPSDATIAAQCFHNLTSAHTNDMMEWGSLKYNVKAVVVDEQGTKETEVAAKGGKDTLGPCASPHLFTNTTPQLSTCLSSKGQHAHHFISSISTPSHSAIQKQTLKAQPWCLRLSPVHSPPSPPFKWQPLGFYSTYPPWDTFQPYQDKCQTSKRPLLSVRVDVIGNTSPSMYPHSNSSPAPSQDFYQYLASPLSCPPTPVIPFKLCFLQRLLAFWHYVNICLGQSYFLFKFTGQFTARLEIFLCLLVPET